MIKFKTNHNWKEKKRHFGTLSSPDDSQIFQAYEIQFHTPGEHAYLGESPAHMEVQILHKAIAGNFQYQAVVAQPYHRSPGEVPKIFNNINLLTLPDPTDNIA